MTGYEIIPCSGDDLNSYQIVHFNENDSMRQEPSFIIYNIMRQ